MEEDGDYIRFVFDLLGDLYRLKSSGAMQHPDNFDHLNTKEMQSIVNEHVRKKNPSFTNHGQRIIHFILYLNMDLDTCNWIKTDQSLNLHRYLHTRPISKKTYEKLVDILHLKTYMFETIMCTPYSFCADLVQVLLAKIKLLDKFSQLTATENLILALLKCVKRALIQPDLEGAFTSHFNQAMTVFTKDISVEGNLTQVGHEDKEQKELTKYSGFRLRSILKIYVELIHFKSTPDNYIKSPLYKLSSIRTPDASPDIGVTMFKKFTDTIMHKCIHMCDFSIDNWLTWYEVEVTEEDTNLQASIGYLCHELCSMIDKGYLDDSNIKDYRAVLGNMAIERINFCVCDINNIGEMIERVIKSPKCHQNGWVKKLVENHNIFGHPQAVDTLNSLIDSIDYNCFKCIVDNCMRYYESGGIPSKSVGELVYKGLLNMDSEDKMKILKHVVSNYPRMKFYFSNDFDNTLTYVLSKEFERDADKNELTSKLIWLVVQQPRQMLHLFIAQYITGICGFCPKVDFTKNFVYRVMAQLHIFLGGSYVFLEYTSWLDFNKDLMENQKINLRNWVIGYGGLFRLMKPKVFLVNVLAPLLHPSSDYKHLLYLINIVRFILNECHVARLTDVDLWDRLLIQLAKILDDARWTMGSYSTDRTQLCEYIIQVLQPLLNNANYLVTPIHLKSIRDEIADLHLLTRSHFLRLWSPEESVNGMYDRFIMTTQSIHHISSININRSSPQQTQEEFIFSIATYMPRFTMHEMQNFIINYFYGNTIQNTDIKDSAFFLIDCVLNAFMRIIVYMKTAIQNDPSNDIKAWDYLDNAIVNFLDCINTSCMNAIYDCPNKELAFLTSTKILMILKQMDDSRQKPLLVILRRLIHATIGNLNKENVSKLLSMIVAIKTTNCSEILASTTNQLIEKLKEL